MPSISQIITFLKLYFGASLTRLLAMLYRSKTEVEGTPSVGVIDTSTDNVSATSHGLHGASEPLPTPEPESTHSEVTGEDLLRAAVDFDLEEFPSLPSIFKFPEARPPLDVPVSAPCKQDFGPPSNLYYEKRLPFGNISNFPRFDPDAKGMKLDTEVKARKPKSKRGRRLRSKNARPMEIPTEPSPVSIDEEPSSLISTVVPVIVADPPTEHVTATESVTAPDPSSVVTPAPIVALELAPAPGSEEWNTTKAALLAQARSWNDRVKASRPRSLPPPAAVQVDIPASKIAKRHSAPPVLVPASRPRSNLEDRLSALFKDAKDTIAALEVEEKKTSRQWGSGVAGTKHGKAIDSGAFGGQEIRRFSAVALEEGRDVFIIGADDDDEEEEKEVITTAPCSSRQQQHAEILPTVNPGSPRLISSISASQSMVALASASSRSLSDLLDSFDAVMAGPTWRRILSRSDDISRRNDSIV
ncbi:F-box domain-containing protein [Mycena venus]|uniref:F-box domain-containing protein n=1 Tax=Mycena venus TaxID=2733690 RepID=A0A8H6WY82_9AGAR|nr:F-box domain-containing protein [Mycena venus]